MSTGFNLGDNDEDDMSFQIGIRIIIGLCLLAVAYIIAWGLKP